MCLTFIVKFNQFKQERFLLLREDIFENKIKVLNKKNNVKS